MGHMLYPLNQLEHHHPELYARQRAKYDDHPHRQRLPARRLPRLNCLWNDVLHLAPLHPHLIHQAWSALGRTLPSAAWFQIPVERMAHLPAVVYHHLPSLSVGDTIPEGAVSMFDPTTYRELEQLPESTLAWYEQLHAQGRAGGWFVHVPHVLVQGAINVEGVERVSWEAVPKMDDLEGMT